MSTRQQYNAVLSFLRHGAENRKIVQPANEQIRRLIAAMKQRQQRQQTGKGNN